MLPFQRLWTKEPKAYKHIGSFVNIIHAALDIAPLDGQKIVNILGVVNISGVNISEAALYIKC